MRSIRTTPTAIIEQIKVNLRDRYHSGFPVLKELVQNADDALALRLDVGWLPHARGDVGRLHPLLRGPGVFVLNNGSFTDDDADKIALMGMGSKGGRPASVGKFGLGLKSVFHLCEAFFYVAHALPGQPADRVRKEFVNPWAETTLHPEWKRDISDEDAVSLCRSLRPLIPENEGWFLLWLPLRTRAQLGGTAPLIAAYPGEPLTTSSPGGFAKDPGDCIFFNECDDNLATLMPMLKTVRQVRGWTPSPDEATLPGATELKQRFGVTVLAGSTTTAVAGKSAAFAGRIEGKVSVDRPGTPQAAPADQPRASRGRAGSYPVHYVGTERWLDSARATSVQSSNAWPQRIWTDPETGQDCQDKEKAIPHVAAYFVVRKSAPNGARLKIVPAVFLPVGEAAAAEHPCKRADYQLVLHGYFFVDAGRKGIDFGDHVTDSVDQPEQTVRRDWNRLLRDEGIMPLVLPALDRLAARLGRASPHVDDLTSALAAIKDFGGDPRSSGRTLLDVHRKALCGESQWVKRLNPEGGVWERLPAGHAVYTLPAPDAPAGRSGADLPYRVFPRLAALQAEAAIAQDGCPSLCLRSPEPLPAAMLVRLLADGENGFDPSAVFGDAAAAEYLVETASHVVRRSGRTAELEKALARAARSALRVVDATEDSPLVKTLARLVAFIPADRRLPLRCNSRLPDEILSFDCDVLVVPATLDPRDPSVCAGLSAQGAAGLLEQLESVADGGTAASSSTRSDLACQILEACDPKAVRRHVLSAIGARRLFDGVDLRENRASAFTAQELEAARARGLLFVRTERSERMARLMQKAVLGQTIVLVGTGVGRAVLGGSVACDAAACVAALGCAERLAGPAARGDLLHELLSAEHLWKRDEDARRAIRYMLHGRHESLALVDQRLFAPRTAGPWAALLGKLLGLRGEDWRVIAAGLADLLSPAQAQALGVEPIAPAPVALYVAATAASADGASSLSGLDCSDMSDADLDALAFEFPLTIAAAGHDAESMRRALPVHRTVAGMRTRVGTDGYLDDPERGFDLDEGLLSRVTLFSVDADPVRAAKQGELFGPARRLTPGAVLSLTAQHGAPPVHWNTVLLALNKAGDHPALDDLRSKRWVPTRSGSVAAPLDILHVPGVDLAREVPELGLTCESDLSPEFTKHRCYPSGRKLFLKAEEALTYIGERLRPHARYLLGPEEVGRIALPDLLRAFEGDGQCMPCAALLRQLAAATSEDLCRDHFIPHLLARSIDADRLVLILEHLARRDETEDDAEDGWRHVHDAYLAGAARQADFADAVLPRIRLLNRRGKWCPSGELCVDWPGVAGQALLDATQQAILGDRVGGLRSADQRGAEDAKKGGEDVGSGEAAARRSAVVLREFFAGWSVAPPGGIAGFLSVLGDEPGVVALAEELQSRKVTGIRDMLPWKVLKGTNMYGAGEDAHQMIGSCRFVVRFDDAPTVQAFNLLGRPFSAPLAKNPGHLMVGRPRFLPKAGTGRRLRFYQLVLRRQEPAGPSEASDILRETTRLILDHVYCQWNIDLQDVWQDLAATEQLDIAVTQSLLLRFAPANLPKLRTDRIPSLRQPLLDLNDAAHRQEEAKQAAAQHRAARVQEAAAAVERAERALVKLLTTDPLVQAQTVEALRAKVRESGYTPSSIPFELWQNADDASVEYHEMHGTSAAGRPESSTFVVECDGARLRFLHWGRPINKFRFGSFDGSGRGFRTDLSKMLGLGESDKFAGVDVKTTTGRFGLGFKSVFLVADRPRVLSAWLAFEVKAGIYPERLDGESTLRLRHSLTAFGPPDGTLIEVDVNHGPAPLAEGGCLNRFLSLAHLLVVCARQIRRCEVRSPDRLQTFQWDPTPLTDVPGVQRGIVRPAGADSTALGMLVFASPVGKVLMAMTSAGPVAFAPDVPNVWVTAPTDHCDGLGIVLNGDFDLDPGRTQLLSASSDNVARAGEIGRVFARQLDALCDAAEHDWEGTRSALGLDSATSPFTFWSGVFDILGVGFRAAAGRTKALASEVLWAAEDRGMHHLVARRRVVPTGLPGAYAALVRPGDARFVIGQTLMSGERSSFDVVSGWESFRRRVRPGTALSAGVAQTLEHVGVRAPAWTQVTLADVVEFELDGSQAEPPSAARLATVVSRRDLEDGDRGHRVQTPERLKETLRRVQFKARDGRWHPASDLLSPGASGKADDESKRAAFAPPSAVLSSDYGADASEFFRLCRGLHGRLRTGVAEMVRWVAGTFDDEARAAVLRYLADGELASGLGDELRRLAAEDASLWLNDLGEGPLLARVFSDINHRQLVLARVGLIRAIEPRVELLVIPPPPPPPANLVLRNIAAAWRRRAEDGRRHYEQEVFFEGTPPQCRPTGLATDRENRREWMHLLMLGAMHTIGLARPAEHREFMRLCDRKGWLDVFADPDIDPGRWLEVLDQYLDPAVRDAKYYRGMQRFISFYQFARHLADYARSFLDMNAMGDSFALGQVLRSRENPFQSGGGVDVPPLTSALGIGACFVVRELVRARVIVNPAAHRYCYVPVRRVRLLLTGLGCAGLMSAAEDRWERSRQIHAFLSRHLSDPGRGDDPTFGGDFDLPLLAAADGELGAYGLPEETEAFIEKGMQDFAD